MAGRQEVERGVAVALGAPPDVAAAAVAALHAQDVLEHGVLFLAVLASARWGTDVTEALRRFADGTEAPSSWSDYEARTAREEAQEEAEAALARLAASGGADVVGPASLAALRAAASG